MRAIWSEVRRRRLWRRIWVALAEAQYSAGLVTAEQVADLRAHADQVDIDGAISIEAEIEHDLMAEVHVFARQCPVGGGIIHLGATSSDIKDNCDALRLCEATDLILQGLESALENLADQIDRWADFPAMAWTHLQPAEPTTIGYRLAHYGQDLLVDWSELRRVRENIKGKGLKGAVGTSASFTQLLAGTGISPAELEERVMTSLGLQAYPVATQTYPRKQDWMVLNALAGLAGTLYKFAFDLRFLQTPPVGEWAEPFGEKQVGSSAMPFKRNPVNAETMNSLARYVASLPHIAWENAAHLLLERTLDDSANRRIILPSAFLATDELLRRGRRLLGELQVSGPAVECTLSRYGTFAATERLLMELVRAGADRQEMHKVIRWHSMEAWKMTSAGESNPLVDLLAADPAIQRYLPVKKTVTLMDPSGYVGDAVERARAMAEWIRDAIN